MAWNASDALGQRSDVRFASMLSSTDAARDEIPVIKVDTGGNVDSLDACHCAQSAKPVKPDEAILS